MSLLKAIKGHEVVNNSFGGSEYELSDFRARPVKIALQLKNGNE